MSVTRASRAAPFGARVAAAARAEAIAFVRRGESLFVTMLVPIIVLVFVSWKGASLLGGAASPDRLVPAVLALALIASAFVSTAISTGYDRKYGVLRRLGVTPLGRRGLVSAKIIVVLAVVVVQTAAVLVTAALSLSWGFEGNVVAFAGFIVFGTAAFTALGLLMAGIFSAEMTLALSNAVFVMFTLFGGVLVPRTSLGEVAARATSVLPSSALADGLRAATDGTFAPGAFIVLVVWTLACVLAALKTFRWE
jgi:ABC-2 type transport system permease protein